MNALQHAAEKLLGKLDHWLEALLLLLPNAILAVLVVLIAWFVAKLLGKISRRGMGRFTDHQPLVDLVGRLVAFTVIAAGIIAALGIVQLQKAVTSLLAGAGIVALVLGFAFQDLSANFVAGVAFALKRPFRPGHLIETSDHLGIVERVELRSTLLRSLDGQILIIPNKKIFENVLVNYSELGMRRVALEVGVSYGSDLPKVKEVTLAALAELPHDESRPLDLYFEGFGDSSINYTVRFWIPFESQPQWLEARSRAVMAIHAAYDDAGITIPFPIRTLDFGEIGGEKLASQLTVWSESRARLGEGPGGDGPA